MSNYIWNWWFVLNTIALVIGLMVGNQATSAIIVCVLVSWLVWLNIEIKPEKS